MSETYILLHGLTGLPEAWDAVLRALPPGARVLRPSLAGHGPRPVETVDWEGEVTRLLGFFARERVSRAHLVGYSLGGRLALDMLAACAAGRASRHLFRKATLIGAHPGLERSEARAARLALDGRWSGLLRRDGLERFVSEWETIPLWESQIALDPETRAARRRMRLSHRASALADAIDALGLAKMPDLNSVIETIETPITWVAGALDERHTNLSSAAAARGTQHRFVAIEGSGHDVTLERPEALARTICRGAP